jgi:RHS repeat-associated protein
VSFDPWLSAPPTGEARKPTLLTLNRPIDLDVSSLGWLDLSLEVPANQSLLLSVQPLSPTNQLWAYSRLGTLPTLSSYDARTTERAQSDSYELLTTPTQAATYFLSVFNRDVSAPTIRVRVLARLVDRHLSSMLPSRAGNTGRVTVQISGLGLVEGMQIQLERSGVAPMVASSVTRSSPQALSAAFELNGATAGTYTLRVKESGKPDLLLANAFSVTAGIGPRLEARIEVPSAVRPQRFGTAWLIYANTGDADMPAPVFVVSTRGNAIPLRLGEAGPFETQPVQALGINTSGPAGVLPPGASGRIPIFFQAATNERQISFSLEVLDASNAPVNWNALEAELRPADFEPTLWNGVWAEFKRQVGASAADYQRALASRATYLSQHGSYVSDVQELLALIFSRATGTYSQQTLAASVDAAAPTRGLGLTFTRMAPDNVELRFEAGPFGRGWTHSFAFRMEKPDTSSVLIVSPDQQGRRFIKRPDGTWQPGSGDSATLSVAADGSVQLRETDGVVWGFAGDGKLRSIGETNGSSISLQYNGALLSTITHSAGPRFALEYNAQGRIVRLVDHAGRATRYTYDATGTYLTGMVAPGDVTTAYAYTAPSGVLSDHALSSITLPDNTHLYYAYDQRGRISARWRDGNTERVTFSYDDLGAVTITDANGATTVAHFGGYGQALAVENSLGQEVSFAYDARRNTAAISQPNGTKPELSYDSRGNPTQIEDALGQRTQLGYTADLAQLDWLRDAKGNLTNFAYDARGNVSEVVYPDSSAQRFSYQANGDLLSATNRRGGQIQFAYNASGQVTQKSYPDGAQIRYTYDAVGRLVKVNDASGDTTMTYDGRGYMTRIAYPSGRSFTFAYNNSGRRTRSTSDDGYVLSYAYDSSGRLTRLSDGGGAELVRYEYDASGRLTREVKGNRTATAYTYDAAGQVLSIVNTGPANEVQSQFAYTYDSVGNRTAMTSADGTTRYRYDGLGQLVGVTYPDGTIEGYSYDAAGNRISSTRANAATSYSVNALNQYTRAGDASYSYDADGNLAGKAAPSGTTTYTYDIENRLVRVAAPGNTWEYRYDALGNRVATIHNGAQTNYAYDPVGLVNLAAEYDASGALVSRYVHGIGLVARIDAANKPAYYAFDALGNTRQLTDNTGAVANRYSYTPFGTALQASETIPNPFQYVGRFGVMDEGHGLQFMRARYYDPATGRFVSTDPINVGGGLNLYTYVDNNPVKAVDPLGLMSDGWTDIIGGAITVAGATTAFFTTGLTAPLWVVGGITFMVIYGTDQMASGLVDIIADANGIDLEDRGDPLERYGREIWGDRGAAAGRISDLLLSIKDFKKLSEIDNLIDATDYLLDMYSDVKSTIRSVKDICHYVPQGCSDIEQAITNVVRPFDPNDKLGPASYGIAPGQSLAYTIRFENIVTATASVQELIVTDQLDPDLDWSTLTFRELGLGDQQINVAGDGLEFTTRFIPPSNANMLTGSATGQLAIDITGSLDATSGLLTWRLKLVDTLTGDFPEDALAGFLPPENGTGRGQGYVSFSIRPKPRLPLGTPLTNRASIVFDTNAPILTNQVVNSYGFLIYAPMLRR